MGRGLGGLSSLIRTRILFLRLCPHDSVTFQSPHLLALSMGVRFQHMNWGVGEVTAFSPHHVLQKRKQAVWSVRLQHLALGSEQMVSAAALLSFIRKTMGVYHSLLVAESWKDTPYVLSSSTLSLHTPAPLPTLSRCVDNSCFLLHRFCPLP